MVEILVESPPRAVAGDVVDIALLEAVAHPFGELGGVFVALALFAGTEGAGFAARDLLVRGHAFQQELRGGDGDLDWRTRVNL